MNGNTEQGVAGQEEISVAGGEERMFRMICNTSSSAILYYNFQSGLAKTLANWKSFFDIEVKNEEDFEKIYGCVEKQYV